MYTFVIVVIIVIIIDNSMRCIFVFINQSYVLEDFLAVWKSVCFRTHSHVLVDCFYFSIKDIWATF